MNRLKKIKERAVELGYEDIPLQEFAPTAREAGVDGIPTNRDYAELSRGPNDVILSGPLLGAVTADGHTPRGRMFSSREAALAWAQEKYGPDSVSLMPLDEEVLKWAVMVKNLRK